jgi:hypothetical protein
MCKIPRYALGFKFFGALEQCDDGTLMKAEEVDAVIHEKDVLINALQVREADLGLEYADELEASNNRIDALERDRGSYKDMYLERGEELTKISAALYREGKESKKIHSQHNAFALLGAIGIVAILASIALLDRAADLNTRAEQALADKATLCALQEKNYGL